MMDKQTNECSSVLLVYVCMRAHTRMSTVTTKNRNTRSIYWCIHLPICPSIYTIQHSYTRTLTHFHAHVYSPHRARVVIRVSTLRNVPKIQGGVGVHYRAKRRAKSRMQHVFNSTHHCRWCVCVLARERELAHALCVCVCLCYRRKYLSVCGPPARLTFSYTHTAAAAICSSCGRGLFVVASNVNLEEEDRRELQARASSTMFEQYENFSPPHTSLIRCTILIL